MNSGRKALIAAIDTYQAPSRIKQFRQSELVDGIDFLLLLIVGDPDTEAHAIAVTGRSAQTLRKAAEFFVEQVLFAPDANAYRILGANPGIEPQDLRRNMALILRWLHPDLNKNDQVPAYTLRVTSAWNHLKTPDLRQAYDASLSHLPPRVTSRRKRLRFIGRAGSAQVVPRVPQKSTSKFVRTKAKKPQSSGLWKFLTFSWFGK